MKKQIQSTLPVLFIVLANLTGYGQKQGEEFVNWGIRYKISQTITSGIAAYPELRRPGAVTVVGYIGVAKEVPIPALVSYQGGEYLVTEIGDNAFRAKGLTSVTLPSTLTAIGDYAFDKNHLTSVTIGDSVISIGRDAFYGNQLTNVTIGNNVTSIGEYAFALNQLTNVTIGNNVTSIGSHAFAYNELTSVTLPNSVTRIDVAAFAVNRLTHVTIPGSVTHIPNYAFHRNQLTSVTLPNSLETIGTHAFHTNQLTSVTLPNSLKTIGNSAFWDNDLTEVTLPGNVTRIDQWAFWDNLNLALVIVEANDPPVLHADAFKNRDLRHLVVPRGKKQDYLNNGWAGFRSIVEVNGEFTVDHITYRITGITSTFRKVSAINYNTAGGRTVDIPQAVDYGPNTYNVTAIGQDAFRGKKLEAVTIPGGVTSIGTNAFGDNDLTEVNIPGSVTRIEEAAFAVNQLDRVTIPSSVTSIPNYAFQKNQLTSVTLPNTLTRIGTHAFWGNQLTEVTLPNSLKTIGNSAFWDNDLTEVTLPGNVTRIDQWAFWDNLNLALVIVEANDPPGLHADAFKNRNQIAVAVPKGTLGNYQDNTQWEGFQSMVEVNAEFTVDHITYRVTSLAPYEVKAAGYSVTGGAVTIPSTVDHGPNTYTVTGIGDKAFQYRLLTSVTLPNTVTSIGEGAFNSNELASVVIPNSVTAIGYQAFSSNQLTEVTIPDSVTSIGGAAFQHNHLTRVTIGKSVTSIGTVAFRNNPGLATVVTKATIPPSLHANAFQNRGQIDVDVPLGKGQVYLDNGWTGFRSITEVAGVGDTFIADHITYKVTSLAPSPYEVKVADYAITGGAVTIPQTVDEGPNTYTVTAIGNEAFLGNQLTGVTLPNTVTSIGHWAFRNNPDLATVVTKATVPPSLHAIAFQNAGRNQIDVNVPKGKRQAYLDNGWTGFNSITEAAGIRDTFSTGHITYKVTSLAPLKVEAIGYNTTIGASVNIPPTVEDGPNTYTVTSIGDHAFFTWHGDFTSVTLPNSVTSIGDHAFGDNDLTEVTLPNSLKTIGNSAFSSNHLTEVTLPNSVTSIGDGAFSINQLTEVTLPDSLKTIGNSAFSSNQLTSVTLPDSVTSIGDQAFAYNPNLATVVTKAIVPPSLHQDAFVNADRDQIDLIVPSGTKGAYPAAGWTGFRSITPAGGEITFIVDHITYGVISLVPYEVEAVDYAITGGAVTIPSTVDHGLNTYTVTAIGDHAFAQNSLTSVTIPNDVTSIGDQAFQNNQLISVTIPNDVTRIGNRAFENNQLTSVTIPNGVTIIESSAFSHNQLTVMTIPNDVTSIESDAFSHNQLTSVTIPNGVDRIGNSAFYNNQLTSVTIPNSVTIIENSAFENNPNLATVVTRATAPPLLHQEPNVIGQHTFRNANRDQIDLIVPAGRINAYLAAGWTGFKSIKDRYARVEDTFIYDDIEYRVTSLLPNTVIAIDYRIPATTDVNIPETANYQGKDYTVTSIGDDAFKEKELTSVTIPNSVTSIGDRAFENNQLTEVNIPNGVTSIGEWAFENNQLTEVNIPNGVTSIGASAFYRNQLTSVTIPNGVTSIENSAFSWNHLTSVTIPNSVTSIGDDAFNQNSLTNVTIPDSVTSIGDGAFWDNRLTSVIIPNSVTSIGGAAFWNNHLTSVTIGNRVTSIGYWAFSYNHLTSVTIPNSVTSIEASAFGDNPDLTTVVTKATDPPSLHADAFRGAHNLQIDLRARIDLIVPTGTKDAYLAAGWTGFKSITEAAMTAQGAAAQRSGAKASTVKSAEAPAHGNKSNAHNTITVYPNPAHDNIHIRLSDGEELQQVNLYNTLGGHTYSANTLQIDVSHLPGGIYMLEIETKAGEKVVKRVIIQ